MMKKLLTAMLIISQSVYAQNWDDPNRKFEMNKNTHEEMLITIKPVPNVQQACETESRRRLGKSFGFAVNACSFWDGNRCVIIVPQRATMHTLGHELLHCYQGNWH
jgi:hypothetical protein